MPDEDIRVDARSADGSRVRVCGLDARLFQRGVRWIARPHDLTDEMFAQLQVAGEWDHIEDDWTWDDWMAFAKTRPNSTHPI